MLFEEIDDPVQYQRFDIAALTKLCQPAEQTATIQDIIKASHEQEWTDPDFYESIKVCFYAFLNMFGRNWVKFISFLRCSFCSYLLVLISTLICIMNGT